MAPTWAGPGLFLIHFLPNYFQNSGNFFQVTCKIRTSLARSDIFFQDTNNNAQSFQILEVKSDRFLQKVYGSSTRDHTDQFKSEYNNILIYF